MSVPVEYIVLPIIALLIFVMGFFFGIRSMLWYLLRRGMSKEKIQELLK